jgi:hypothetical protein
MNNTPKNFCKRAREKKVLNCLILITETTLRAALPITLFEIILCKNDLIVQESYKNSDFKWNLNFPNIFFIVAHWTIKQIKIHRLNRELPRYREIPMKDIIALRELNSHESSNKVYPSIPPVPRERPPKTYV